MPLEGSASGTQRIEATNQMKAFLSLGSSPDNHRTNGGTGSSERASKNGSHAGHSPHRETARETPPGAELPLKDGPRPLSPRSAPRGPPSPCATWPGALNARGGGAVCLYRGCRAESLIEPFAVPCARHLLRATPYHPGFAWRRIEPRPGTAPEAEAMNPDRRSSAAAKTKREISRRPSRTC